MLSNKKRYYTLNEHMHQRFGEKVVKISLNAGLTCPNQDGTCGVGGCTYCSSVRSGDFAGKTEHSLFEQFCWGKELLQKKWPNAKYIAYFQAGTNTYAPTETLKKLYDEALCIPDVVGLSVATRPDCLPEAVLNLLSNINRMTYLTVELGLQTIHNETAHFFHRGYDYSVFEQAVKELHRRGIRICVHIINGLPGETIAMMRETVSTIVCLPIDAIKIHSLYLLQNTVLGEEYRKTPFPLLTKEEYVNLVCDQIELLPKHIVVERVTGDGPYKDVIAPEWSLHKQEIMNAIDKELERRNSCQGKNFAG